MGEGFQTVLSERHRESLRFVRIERHVPRVGAACDFIQVIFLADFLKLCQVGWGASLNSNLQVFLLILNGIQVWALAGPLRTFLFLFWSHSSVALAVLGVVVLLERKSSSQFKVFCTLKQVLLEDLPVFSSIHCSLYPYKSPNPCRWKVSP